MTIAKLIQLYKNEVDYLDLEIIMANSLNKTREFVLIHPEYSLTESQAKNLKLKIQRRLKGEPVAYILGHKEFYGLDFIVNKHTLVPRPETELMIEQTLELLRDMPRDTFVIDVGTGSGNIIISIAHESKKDVKYHATDISKDALKIAKKNARTHGVDKKIKFLHGNLLSPLLKEFKTNKLMLDKLIITANLPYLSKEIYNSAPIDVKKFEPKSALYSPEQGLQHYRKLLEQSRKILTSTKTILLEISPEQKQSLTKLVKTILPLAKIKFEKDLAGKWRICIIEI